MKKWRNIDNTAKIFSLDFETFFNIYKLFEKEISKIYNLENVSIVDKAMLAKAPYNVNIIKDIKFMGEACAISTASTSAEFTISI